MATGIQKHSAVLGLLAGGPEGRARPPPLPWGKPGREWNAQADYQISALRIESTRDDRRDCRTLSV